MCGMATPFREPAPSFRATPVRWRCTGLTLFAASSSRSRQTGVAQVKVATCPERRSHSAHRTAEPQSASRIKVCCLFSLSSKRKKIIASRPGVRILAPVSHTAKCNRQPSVLRALLTRYRNQTGTRNLLDGCGAKMVCAVMVGREAKMIRSPQATLVPLEQHRLEVI